MGKIADPLRAFVTSSDFALAEVLQRTDECLLVIADEIDREHERRMEQSRHETKRAFAKYIRQITEEYERSHKRKSWLRQQEMQLELDVLRYKERKAGK